MSMQCHVNANLDIHIILIKYLVHKLLGIVTRLFVSLIKVPVLLQISALKKLFPVCVQICQLIKVAMNIHIIITFHMEKFLWKFFFNDRKLQGVCQFSHRYFEWKLDLYFG